MTDRFFSMLCGESCDLGREARELPVPPHTLRADDLVASPRGSLHPVQLEAGDYVVVLSLYMDSNYSSHPSKADSLCDQCDITLESQGNPEIENPRKVLRRVRQPGVRS